MLKVLSDWGMRHIEEKEGLRLEAYQCQAGIWTIGYGHTGPDVHPGMRITKEQAVLLLDLDTNRFEAKVNTLCPQTTQEQFDAMVGLCYNIGEAAFASSSVCRLHNAGEYAQAAQAFNLYNKYRDPATKKLLVSRGLTERRAVECSKYLEGQFDDTYMPPSYAEGETPLARSRTMSGGTAALATTAVTGVASQTDILAAVSDHQDLLMQVAPFIRDHMWIVFVAIALLIGYMMYARASDRSQGRS